MTRLIQLNGNTYYAAATGLKIGYRGKVQPTGNALAALPKGDARKLRKAARAAGRYDIAGAPRR